MFKWLRKKLRDWLLADDELSFELECFFREKNDVLCASYLITGSVGLCLEGTLLQPPGTGARLIGEGVARDKAHFWKLWHYFNPGTSLTWESDGAKFDPIVE